MPLGFESIPICLEYNTLCYLIDVHLICKLSLDCSQMVLIISHESVDFKLNFSKKESCASELALVKVFQSPESNTIKVSQLNLAIHICKYSLCLYVKAFNS